jgi:hypothetical protein
VGSGARQIEQRPTSNFEASWSSFPPGVITGASDDVDEERTSVTG